MRWAKFCTSSGDWNDVEMSKAFIIAFAGAVVVIAVLVWSGFRGTQGNHLVPAGSIGKVRTIKPSDDVTFMVIDFKIKNDSDQDMVVHSVEPAIDAADGSTVAGHAVAAIDVVSAFRGYPELGEQYNPVLKDRDVIQAHQTLDRMVGIRFDAPFEKVEARRRVTLRIEDITGPVLELTK
jgi:hypothetical protein